MRQTARLLALLLVSILLWTNAARAQTADAAEEAARKDQVKREFAHARALLGDRRPVPPRALRLTGLGFGAAGALSLGIGLLYALSARSTADQVAGARQWNAGLTQEYENGSSDNVKTIVLCSVGGALLA